MSDLRLGIVFDVRNGRFRPEVQQNTRLVEGFGNSTQRTAGQTRQLSAALDNTNHNLIATNRVAQSVTRGLSGMFAGVSAGLLISELSQTTRTFQVLRATLETATGSKEKAADAFERLQKFAASTPYSVKESIQAFIKLKNLGLDPTEAALNSYGNTASAMGKSLDQFIEAVADASVSEFERLKEFGIKAKNQGDTIAFTFRKNKTEVANNATAIEQYLQNLGKNEFGGAMERQAATYDGAVSNMGDSWDQFLLKISDGGAGNVMEDTVRGTASSLNFLALHVEKINTLFSVGLVVATGHALTAIYAKTVAMRSAVVANTAVLNANVATARSESILATSANLRAVQEQAAASRSLAVASTTIARTTATNNLAIANGQVMATERALIASRTALTVATRAASITTRALSGAMALLGGPAGVIMLAGFALYSYATSSDNASSKTKLLATDVENLTKKYKTLAVTKLRVHLLDVNNALEAQKNKLNTLKSTIENTGKSSSSSGLYDAAQIKSYIGLETISKEGKEKITRAIDQQADANKLLNQQKALQLKLIKQIAFLDGGGKPEAEPKKPSNITPPDNKKLGKDLAGVEQSLLNKEGVINASYVRQQSIVDNSLAAKLISEEKYNTLSLQLDVKKDLALKALSDQKLAQEKERAEQKATAAQKTIDDEIQADLNVREQRDQFRRDGYAAELAELRGFNVEKLAIKAGSTEEEIAQAQARNLALQAEEFAHNERVMSVKTRKTGDMQGTLMQFANFEKKTQLEKTSAVIGIGEYGFKAMAGQSKKAFAMYKAFSIGQALIKTYEAATGAYAALAPIPIIGPALGAAAAAAAVVSGMAQVGQIKSQQPPGYYEGGNIGGNNIIEFGERNKPEVLEFEGKNYLLGGNGGAVFNRSQLNQVGANSTTGTASGGGSKVTVNLIEDASKAGQVSQSKGLNNEDVIRIFVSDIRQGGDSSDAMELTYGLQRTGT